MGSFIGPLTPKGNEDGNLWGEEKEGLTGWRVNLKGGSVDGSPPLYSTGTLSVAVFSCLVEKRENGNGRLRNSRASL